MHGRNQLAGRGGDLSFGVRACSLSEYRFEEKHSPGRQRILIFHTSLLQSQIAVELVWDIRQNLIHYIMKQTSFLMKNICYCKSIIYRKYASGLT